MKYKGQDTVGSRWVITNKEKADGQKKNVKGRLVAKGFQEIENLEKYEVFEEVKYEGQETVGSRWVITKKEKADGQKKNVKGRLVAKGFQEIEAPQSDSPTMLRESMKLFFAVAANQDFKLRSIDIRVAFLQARELDRDVFLMPPKDIRKEGYVWKLKKPLYGLNDASRKFWLRVKELFGELGLQRLEGDEAVYYRKDKNELLEGMISTCVDDFDLAGTEGFVEKVTKKVSAVLDVSKVEDDKFRYTGIDIKKVKDGIEISMDEYAESLEEIKIREGRSDEGLTRYELKVFRKYIGKLNWLAASTKPDIGMDALL